MWMKKHQQFFDKIKECLANPSVIISPVARITLKLYILASDLTIGSMLAQEDEQGNERVVYYLSRMLNEVEIRYSHIEKLCHLFTIPVLN